MSWTQPQALVLLAAALVGLAGCRQDNSPLSAEPSSVDFGLVVGDKQLSHVFTARAWSRGVVKINGLTVSCGCLTLTDDVEGKEIEPGDCLRIPVRIDTRGRAGLIRPWVKLSTSPPADRPLVVSISAFVEQMPVVTPELSSVVVARGEKASAPITVTRLRAASSAALRIDKGRSKLGPFVLVAERRSTRDVAANASQPSSAIVDRIELQLVSKRSFPIGNHEVAIELAWQGETGTTKIVREIRVLHPLRPSLERVYLGELRAGETRALRVRLECDATEDIRLLRVASDLDFVDARIDPQDNALWTETVAPSRAGRFAGTIKITGYRNADVPDIEIPISGVVASADLRTRSAGE